MMDTKKYILMSNFLVVAAIIACYIVTESLLSFLFILFYSYISRGGK